MESIPDAAIHREHTIWTHYHWHEVLLGSLNADRLSARAAQLSTWHAGAKHANDCRIIAECEQSGADTFATFDTILIRNLREHAAVFIGLEDECWQRLAVPRGAPPRWRLEPEHPLFNAEWWRW